jgi:hypothetical protein
MDYREELELAVDWVRESMPASVQEAIGLAKGSLYGIPGGRWSSLEVVQDWAGNVDSVTLYECDDDGDEYEAGEIPAADIVEMIVGRELARYL